MIQKGNTSLLQRFPKDDFAADADRSKCLQATSSNARSFARTTFSGENVNAMLEYSRMYTELQIIGYREFELRILNADLGLRLSVNRDTVCRSAVVPN